MTRGKTSAPKANRRQPGQSVARAQSLEACALLLSRLVTGGDPWTHLAESDPSLAALLPNCLGAAAILDAAPARSVGLRVDGLRAVGLRAVGATPTHVTILALRDWAARVSQKSVASAALAAPAGQPGLWTALVAFVDERRQEALVFFRKQASVRSKALDSDGAGITAAGSKAWQSWEQELAQQVARAMGHATLREERRSAESHQAEQQAETHQERIRAILSVLQDGILLVDDTGRVEYANQQLCNYMSITDPPEALIGLTSDEIKAKIQPAYRNPTTSIARLGALVAQGKPSLGEEIALADGRTLLRDFIPFPFGPGRVGRLWHLRDITSMREAQSKLAEVNTRLEELSLTDSLTGLANRRQFDRTLAAEWSLCMRLGRPLAVIMLDVDRFKRFNDHYGHQAGDECLRVIGQAMRTGARRASDLAARYGGEEFAIVAVDSDLTNAWTLAEVVRLSIRDRKLPHLQAPAGIVTASAGVAAMVPNEQARPEALLRLADQALYRAKAAGGDRVEVANGGVTEAPTRQG